MPHLPATPTPESPRDNERGAIAVVVALFMLIFMVLLAFVVDFGRIYSTQAQLQNAADSAALAAARDLTALMRFSLKLSYGCVAIKDNQVGVKHSLRMAAADEVSLRKSIFYVARAADMLEAEAGGSDRQ